MFLAVNCTEPPPKPSAGTWEWDGDQAYGAAVTYTCGPYGSFQRDSGELYEEVISSCVWNKTWSPPALDICAATFCQEIPFPPKSIGLVYTPDAKNNITLASGEESTEVTYKVNDNKCSDYSVYNPTLPATMRFPGPQFCGDNKEKMLLVGNIPEESEEPLEIVFLGTGINDEAFHILVDPDKEFVQRWGVFQNTTVGLVGNPGDGTTIDRDEPFVLSFLCDEDGWTFSANKEPNYPHFFHPFSPAEITGIQISGDLAISYVGFGNEGS